MKRLRRAISYLFSLISAVMLGLAAGALWMLPIAFVQARLPWLAVPLGLMLGWAVARWVSPRRARAPWLAAGAALLAVVYVNVLIASVRIAGAMGLGLSDTLRTAGPGMLWSLAALASDKATWIWAALGAGMAALSARRLSRRVS